MLEQNILKRKSYTLDGIWRFQIDQDDIGENEGWYEPKFDVSSWASVQVPGAWDLLNHAMRGYEGVGWFSIDIPAGVLDSTTYQRIHFTRVNIQAKIWLNGIYLGEHVGGDLPFAMDVPVSAVKEGNNRLMVRVDNSPRLEWMPYASVIERVLYGGILRSVAVLSYPAVFLDGAKVKSRLDGQKAQVEVTIRIQNTSENQEQGQVTLTLDSGEEIRVPFNCPPRETCETSLQIKIEQVQKWSPNTPHMYKAQIKLQTDRGMYDETSTRFGIRTISTQGNQILLNGEPIQIKGVNRYDEYEPYGLTVPEDLVRSDLQAIKDTGINLIRMHYPMEESTLDMLDDMGILMMEEVFINWWGAKWFNNYNPPEENAEAVRTGAKRMLEEMIALHYNHPSIIFWSVGNESATDTPIGVEIFSELLNYAHTLDDSRLTTYACNSSIHANAAFIYADVVGMNIYPGVFEPNPVHHFAELDDKVYNVLQTMLEEVCQVYPDKPVIMTEFGTHGVPGIFGDVRFTEDMQAQYIRTAWKAINTVSGMQGGILWCWADYFHRRDLIGTGQMFRAAYGPFGLVTVDRKPKKALQMVQQVFNGA